MTGAAEILAWIAGAADPTERAKLARYGIPDRRAAGIAMRDLLAKAKTIGTDMPLARALWADGGYEARTLAAMIGDASALTVEEMEAWAGDFDSWAICDTVAFRLFDRSPHAWGRIEAWIDDPRPMVRRAGYATLWALALHDRGADQTRYHLCLDRIAARPDEAEPIVAKGIDMALGAIARRPGMRPVLAEKALALADDPTRRKLARLFARAARG